MGGGGQAEAGVFMRWFYRAPIESAGQSMSERPLDWKSFPVSNPGNLGPSCAWSGVLCAWPLCKDLLSDM